MTIKRWIPTFLAFPLGGLIAIETVGGAQSPLSAALGGLVAGAVIGAGQWLALRSGGTSSRWIGRTAAAGAAGAWGLGWLITSQVIVDAERGHHTFGSSGALAATVLTGLALRALADHAAPVPAATRRTPQGPEACRPPCWSSSAATSRAAGASPSG